MPQQKPIKKAATKVVKPTRQTAARAPASASKAKQTKPSVKASTKTSKPAASRKQGVSVGSGSKNKPNNLFTTLFDGGRKWITLAIFILVFGGLGSYFLNKSQALTTNKAYCTGNLFSIKKVKTGQCVADIQRILNGIGNSGGYNYNVGTVDGYIGNKTDRNIKQFQTVWFGSAKADGVVGRGTWDRLCYVAYYNGADSTNAANNAGCGNLSGAYKIGSSSNTSGCKYCGATTTKSGGGTVKVTSSKAINLTNAAMWDRIAMCESTGNWSINTGNGYYGGLQFNLASWRAYGGTDFAAYPHQATRAEQITVANRYFAKAGLKPWGCRGAA